MKKKKDDSSEKLMIACGGLAGVFALGMLGYVLYDNIRDSQPSSNGLNLVSYNAHLSPGVHKVILTDSFYQHFSDNRTEKYQDFAIDCVKKAYSDLNTYTTGIKFDLYTQNDGLLKYGFKKAESIDTANDLPIYVSTESLSTDESKASPIAICHHEVNSFSRELHNEYIKVYKPYIYSIFNSGGKTWEQNFNPSNSYFYATLVHETMHAMGFAHQEKKDSVMYLYSGRTTPHELTEKDIEMIRTYNTTFYKEEIETPVFADKIEEITESEADDGMEM